MSNSLSIDTASSANAKVLDLLSGHPRVAFVETGDSPGIEFRVGAWRRHVRLDSAVAPHYGLIETIDNNPLVCADEMSVPGPAATMALIAMSPIVQAGLLTDPPVLALNFDAGNEDIGEALRTVGWDGDVTVHSEPLDLGGMYAATALACIRTPDDLDDIDALYEERFGRSFYIRQDDSSEWGPQLVAGKPYAVYRLRIVPDEPNSLLTVRALSDPEGKCGACQLIHAMNVMCGFEESLGIR